MCVARIIFYFFLKPELVKISDLELTRAG